LFSASQNTGTRKRVGRLLIRLLWGDFSIYVVPVSTAAALKISRGRVVRML